MYDVNIYSNDFLINQRSYDKNVFSFNIDGSTSAVIGQTPMINSNARFDSVVIRAEPNNEPKLFNIVGVRNLNTDVYESEKDGILSKSTARSYRFMNSVKPSNEPKLFSIAGVSNQNKNIFKS